MSTKEFTATEIQRAGDRIREIKAQITILLRDTNNSVQDAAVWASLRKELSELKYKYCIYDF